MKNKLSNYNFCLSVLELKKELEVLFLTLGEKLLKIRSENLYESQWESFEDYLDEIKMSPSVASRLISVYSKLILEWKIKPELIANAGGWSNAYEIVKVSPTKEDAIKWLEESKDRMPRDTKIMLREAKTGIKQEDCKHEDTYKLTICRKCGLKIYEQED